MTNIYCIEDCNGLKYVGSTNRNINTRLSEHRCDKKINKKNCSSKLLDLSNCKIYILEQCEESKRSEKERYWINKIDCVNLNDLTFDMKEYDRIRNKSEERKKLRREHHHKNKTIRNKIRNATFHFVNGWGGDPRSNNNLLKIDLTIFS